MFKIIKMIALTLVFIGALNWGLVGVFKLDLVAFLLGDMTFGSRLVYSLVGFSALISMLTYPMCKNKE